MDGELAALAESLGALGTVAILVWLLLKEMQRSDTAEKDAKDEVSAYRDYVLKMGEAFEQRVARQDERNRQFAMRMMEYYVHLIDRAVIEDEQQSGSPTRTTLRPPLTPDEVSEYFNPPPGD